jgi:hypothetical protein
MMEQGLGKRCGPIVVLRQRPTGCHSPLYHASLTRIKKTAQLAGNVHFQR